MPHEFERSIMDTNTEQDIVIPAATPGSELRTKPEKSPSPEMPVVFYRKYELVSEEKQVAVKGAQPLSPEEQQAAAATRERENRTSNADADPRTQLYNLQLLIKGIEQSLLTGTPIGSTTRLTPGELERLVGFVVETANVTNKSIAEQTALREERAISDRNQAIAHRMDLDDAHWARSAYWDAEEERRRQAAKAPVPVGVSSLSGNHELYNASEQPEQTRENISEFPTPEEREERNAGDYVSIASGFDD